MKSTGIIIVTYHTGEILFECINAAINQNPNEIIIVDNGNDDTMRQRIKSYGDKIKYIINDENLGFGSACNIGAHATNANTELLLFLNPDAILTKANFEILPNQLIGGMITDENGTEQRGARRGELSLKTAILAFVGKDNFNYTKSTTNNDAIIVPTISGALFAVHKSDFERIGGFDENYFLHVEDIDICKRFRLAGGIVLFNPNLCAQHIGGTSKSPKLIIEYYSVDDLDRILKILRKNAAVCI